jgi:parvulin-like peptidyl-prolyl isomerase
MVRTTMLSRGGWAALGLHALAVAFLTACGAPQDEEKTAKAEVPANALAVVAGEALDDGKLRAYVASIQNAHRSKQKGYDAHLDHLNSFIDSKLMIHEAKVRGHGQNPNLLHKVEVARRKALIETYLSQTVGQGLTISEDELKETFRNNPGHQSVLAAHIRVETNKEADSLYALIQNGADFAELARKHSLDKDTADNGGLFDKYYEFSRVSYNVFRNVFDKEIGHVVEPFRKADGWEIVKVIDRQIVDFNKYRPQVFETAMRTKFLGRRNAHLDSLAERYQVKRDEALYDRFVEAWNVNIGKPDLPPADMAKAIYTYDGGQISVQQVVNVLHNTNKGSAKIAPETLHPHLLRFALGDLLFVDAGEAAGFSDHPDVGVRVEEEREKQLLKLLWEQVLEEEVTATADEAKAHFDANPDYYMKPAEVVVQEVLSATREEAEQVLAELREGADMGPLAASRSIRKLAAKSSGVYGIRSFEGMIYKNLLQAATQAPLNELQGPLEILEPQPSTLVLDRDEAPDRVYSVFKVLERSNKQLMNYDDPETTRRSFFYARQQKQQERLSEYTGQLRDQYRSLWAMDEENLRRYAAAAGE